MSSVTEVLVASDSDGTACAGVSRCMASTCVPGFPESLYWRRLGRRYELLGLASWVVAAVAVVVFVAVLIAARDLLVPAVFLVPLACVMVLVGRWCDRNSRDAWDFAFWSLHAEVRQ